RYPPRAGAELSGPPVHHRGPLGGGAQVRVATSGAVRLTARLPPTATSLRQDASQHRPDVFEDARLRLRGGMQAVVLDELRVQRHAFEQERDQRQAMRLRQLRVDRTQFAAV